MRVSEIFSSLQGEGKYLGNPTTFVRVFGCPFECSYCDTKYAKEGEFKNLSIEKIMRQVNKLGNKYVCITGGEPLLDEDVMPLVYELLSFSYIVSIETSGLVPIDYDGYNRSYHYCMDIKCPSSGMQDKNVFENLANLKAKDEVKFVVSSDEDIEFALKVLKKYPTKAEIIYSPANNDLGMSMKIADGLISKKLKGKLGIQLHRILNIA